MCGWGWRAEIWAGCAATALTTDVAVFFMLVRSWAFCSSRHSIVVCERGYINMGWRYHLCGVVFRKI